MRDSFDIMIVGGGLVGASLAVALAAADVRVALVEPRQPAPYTPDDSWDSRVYAVSPGSTRFLEDCGAWPHLPPARVSRVEQMRIFGDDRAACLEFSAYDAGLPELACIVENRVLHDALWRELQAARHVRLYVPASCESLDLAPDAVTLALADGTRLQGQLLVGADGADSWVRDQAGIAVQPEDYGQLGIVANFACSKPHRGTAYQWFRPDGVLALLPLPGERVSMVWSTPDAHGRELLDATPAELARCVADASCHLLGELSAISPAVAFPLRLQRVSQLVRPRLALVGDAAHNVHPLAGQGVNLGFRDARELAAVVAGRGAQSDCGNFILLRRYERARREDILALQFVTDGLQKLFSARAVWIAKARNAGLDLVNRQPLLKHQLVRQAVG